MVIWGVWVHDQDVVAHLPLVHFLEVTHYKGAVLGGRGMYGGW